MVLKAAISLLSLLLASCYRGVVHSFPFKNRQAPCFVTTHNNNKYHHDTTLFLTPADDHEDDTGVVVVVADTSDTSGTATSDAGKLWLNSALLLSSFSDGLKPNPQAQEFLMRGLVNCLWKERQGIAEHQVSESAVQSPCCGPDLTALEHLETADAAIQQNEEKKSNSNTNTNNNNNNKDNKSVAELIDSLWKLENKIGDQDSDKNDDDDDDDNDSSSSSSPLELRFLYIPTAMYALRSDSNNTPGKQRQRARADGKKRRNEIAQLLSDGLVLGGNDDKEKEKKVLSVLAITLDLEDASVKQPEGSEDSSRFPANGKDAISQWKPHFIYVQGGNTFWLHHCIEKGGWAKDIVNACTGDNAAVYCGTSAGAIIMGESMETACWKGWDDPSVVPGKETYDEWKGVKGLGLAGDNSFFPHMLERWDDLVDEKRKELPADSQVNCLRDDQVCCVDGNSKSISVLSCSAAEAEPQN